MPIIRLNVFNTLVGVESNLENVDKEGGMEEEGMEISEGHNIKKRKEVNVTKIEK